MSTHCRYCWLSMPVVLKAAISWTARASSLASVRRISFSTSVSHSLIFRSLRITGDRNVTYSSVGVDANKHSL